MFGCTVEMGGGGGGGGGSSIDLGFRFKLSPQVHDNLDLRRPQLDRSLQGLVLPLLFVYDCHCYRFQQLCRIAVAIINSIPDMLCCNILVTSSCGSVLWGVQLKNCRSMAPAAEEAHR